jgi:hypothetical protein
MRTRRGSSSRTRARPRNLDAYVYRDGRLEPPVPVQVLGGGGLEAWLFRADEVALDAIPVLVTTALERADLEGGRIALITVRRDLPSSPEVVIEVSVSGRRQAAVLRADRRAEQWILQVL